MSDLFAQLVNKSGTKIPPRAYGPVQGLVKQIVAEGIMFTIPDYDGGEHMFGPAKWNHAGGAAAMPPVPDVECVVVFIGPGLERPWVTAWA